MKTRELHIPENNPFQNDKLERFEFAQSLTNIVANYKDGFVMSLNGPWGTGKTTFLRMWEAQLKNEGYNTILFNAWENDYDNDAFLALFAEVKKNLESKLGESSINLKNLVSKANVFFKPITKAVASGLLKKAMGINAEDLTEEIAAVGSGLSDTLHKSIEEYAARKESVKDFQSLLKDCVGFGKFNTVESDKKEKVFKPLIFIIDELDRCRPNYAVEVLETIKHLFAVDGIVFVLGIDKKHLISSIKGVYGSQDIEGQEYLRRFVDLEVLLPPVTLEYLLQKFIDEKSVFFTGVENIQQLYLLHSCLLELTVKNNISIRQLDKITNLLNVFIFSSGSKLFSFDYTSVFLIFIFIVDYDSYLKIRNRSYNLEELWSLIYSRGMVSMLSVDVNDKAKIPEKNYVVHELLYLYKNYFNGNSISSTGLSLYLFYDKISNKLFKLERENIEIIISKLDGKGINLTDLFIKIEGAKFPKLTL